MLLLVIEGLIVLGEWEKAAALCPLTLEHPPRARSDLTAPVSSGPSPVAPPPRPANGGAERHFEVALQQAEVLPHRLEQVRDASERWMLPTVVPRGRRPAGYSARRESTTHALGI
jgi:hypothetical protein